MIRAELLPRTYATRTATNTDANCNYVSTTAVSSYPQRSVGAADDVTPAQTGNAEAKVRIALRCSTTQRTCYRNHREQHRSCQSCAPFNNNVYSGVVASGGDHPTNGDALL